MGLSLILGFSESFVAQFPCRFCKSPKTLCHVQRIQDNIFLRNIQNYENYVNTIDISLTNIKENSVWNSLNSFRVTENFSANIMHDLFEGVSKYEISGILYKIIIDLKCFSLETLNNKIECFYNGTNDIRNRPPLLFMQVLQSG